MPKTHSEKTSNAKKTIGLDYQYFFFLWRILELKTGESVGLEVADDVHTQLNNSRQILFQLKHTLEKDASGETVKLTKYDPDLWKTLSNWSQVIADGTAGRSTTADQRSFIERTDFVLVSNKGDVTDSELLHLFERPEDATDTLQRLKSGTTNATISGHIDNLLKLDKDILRMFIVRTRFMLGVDEMIKRCKTAIFEKHIREARVDQLFSDLDSRIRQDNYLTVKEGDAVCISFDDFNRKYRGYFDDARSVKLKVRNHYEPLPKHLNQQTFIRQLIDISDLNADDISRITSLTTCKRILENNLTTWELDGDITQMDIDAFDRDSITHWENAFTTHHHDTAQEDKQRGLSVLREIRKHALIMRGDLLGIYVSNGQFYRLADDPPVIGFLSNWKQLYRRSSE